jgi:hypothetical protein
MCSDAPEVQRAWKPEKLMSGSSDTIHEGFNCCYWEEAACVACCNLGLLLGNPPVRYNHCGPCCCSLLWHHVRS